MRLFNLYLLTVLLALCACAERTDQETANQLDLDPMYKKVKTIISLADCNGPGGVYTTEVHSSRDSYTFFKQEFDDGSFEVFLNKKGGWTIDSSGEKGDAISINQVEMIRGHELHKMHMMPELLFTDLSHVGTENYHGVLCEKYQGLDHLKHPVHLYNDQESQLVRGVTLQNSLDTSEIIEIFNSHWTDSDYGKVVEKASIIQAGKDTFFFDFKSVIFNSDEFRRKDLKWLEDLF